MKKWTIYISIFVVLSFLQDEYTLADTHQNSDEAIFTFFSIPDGESMLISTGQKHILINTGSQKSEKALLKQLIELKINHIDTLILTTQQPDACGNTERLVDRYHISKIITGKKLGLNCFGQGNRNFQTVIWGKEKYYEASPGLLFRVIKQEDSGNISLYITFGKTALLYMTEGNEEIEKKIQALPIQAEIMKIPEYASKNFPSVEFLRKIDPHIAIVYSMEEIPFNDALIERLSESWIDVYVLENVGTIQIRSDLKNYEFMK